MISLNERIEILPGVFLRAMTSDKFKTGCFSVNLLRPLCPDQAAQNALVPSVLLRGTARYPNIAAITNRLDDLYGATIGTLVRKKGEVQMVGFYADFIEDCFVPEGVFVPVVELLGEVLCNPLLADGCFTPEAVEGERLNLIHAIESRINDKRSYVTSLMLQAMCCDEAYSEPRLGNAQELEHVTPQSLYAHYREILATSQIEIFYLGRQPQQAVAAAFAKALSGLERRTPVCVQTQIIRTAEQVQYGRKVMDVTQGKLSIGLRTGCTVDDPEYPALMMLNVIFGGGMSCKLFKNVREKRSLCYYANSVIEKYKGIMVVSSGVEFAQFETAKAAILQELDNCRNGEITQEEMEDARRMILSSLASIQDTPGALDDFYLGMAVTNRMLDISQLARAVKQLTVADVTAAAQKVTLDTVFFLTGVTE